MRILHTADWHLGSRLGGYDRTDELFGQVEIVCRLAEEHAVDVLLVAGDVFERRALPELTKHLADTLRPYVLRGLHVVLLPGNHDNREHFRMMRALLTLDQEGQGHVHVVQTREIFTIDSVQFAAIPYPIPEALEPYRPDAIGATESHVVQSTAYASLVRSVIDALDPSLPAVFVSHITVAGVTTPSERELTYDDDIRLGTADLPLASNLAYVALGHIHQPQSLPHPIPCHYSGSIDRYNMGERDDAKQVLLVEVPPIGAATVTAIPIEATPFHDIRVAAAELGVLPDRYPDLDRAFVRVVLDCEVGDDPVALRRQVNDLCARCLEVRCEGVGAAAVSALDATPRDYRTTALDYLRARHVDDPDLPELEWRASNLVDEVVKQEMGDAAGVS